ncbi:MAG: hydrogenase expression/formation protein HupD [Rhodomicrobium sp.]|nr:MAG: hydrogenase expression/formation protein HupD [Rhodomicrobium sp.]
MGSNKILILGIGNLLWADEGFGVRAVEHMHSHYDVPPEVVVLDGGTQGLYLVQHVRECDYLIVFDAVDYGLEPGTMKLVRDKEVPKFLGAKKISLHQTGFQEVLATAEMLGNYPKGILLIGVQPVELEDYGGSLRPEVKDKIEPAIQHAIDFLKDIGVTITKRDVPIGDDGLVGCEVVTMENYEKLRPSEQDACRIGDDRLLVSDAWKGPTFTDSGIAEFDPDYVGPAKTSPSSDQNSTS